jgi:hypothetical protein
VVSLRGTIAIDCPLGAEVTRAMVRVEDVTYVDGPSKIVAQRPVIVPANERRATFNFVVVDLFREEVNRYIVTARAIVRHREWPLPRLYGTTAAYPLHVLVESGGVLVLKNMSNWEGSMSDDAEYQSGSGLKTTYYIVGDRVRAVEYTEIDGLAVAEGCIILGTIGEAEAALAAVRRNPGVLRQDVSTLGAVIRGSQYRWTGGVVPYVLNANLQRQERVTEAIAHWEANTAIRFVARAPANAGQYPDYIEFVPGSGCRSAVGRQGGRQLITLGDACTRGNCIHEIGHALGLWHEQSRNDRDAHIEVVWANIEPGTEANFYQRLHETDDIGTYDFGSIMHYSLTAFSVNGQPTLRVVGNSGGAQVGQRNALSQGDRDTIAAIY